jgi:GR25 family glycosyltransferase involved in LPS biosynthesis
VLDTDRWPASVADLPVYVVSVTTFEERHRHMNAQSEKYGLNLEYIWRFDADSLTDVDIARVEREALPIPSISAVLKHLEAQSLLVSRKQPVCLVLEDDAILFEGFAEKLERTLHIAKTLEPGWLIFLGGADNSIDVRFLNSREFRLIEQPISTAEAYIIDFEGCRRRLLWLQRNAIDRPADHFLKVLDHQLGNTQYWVSSPAATQGSITGRFRTTLDASRAKHGRVYLLLRYWYNRVRKQLIPRAFKG